MDSRLKDEIANKVFRGKLSESSIEDLAVSLDMLLAQFEGQLEIDIKIATSSKYFTLRPINTSVGKSVVSAGAIHQGRPSIRVRNGNPILSRISQESKWPFTQSRKEEWTCVSVEGVATTLLVDLISSEIGQHFGQHLQKRKGKPLSSLPTEPPTEIPMVIPAAGELDFTGGIASVDSLRRAIRNSPSTLPSALPLRGNNAKSAIWDNLSARRINQKQYSRAKDLLMAELGLKGQDGPGLYFFLRKDSQGDINYYYIGLAESIERRLAEHLTRRDFVFYALEFPEFRTRYLNEALEFYGGQPRYARSCSTYEVEVNSLEEVELTHIAWISAEWLTGRLLDNIETALIVRYQPPANVAKKNLTIPTSVTTHEKLVKGHLQSLIEAL